ncbi:MAG: acetolactate synthase small subunit [Geothrix sp.]|jgi:acetolactate synthase-1/3 small subunit|nr:acetolactate synthase small subunit [Geothrix sp.]
MSHVLVVYTDDEPGVLTRVASLFRRRGFNIHSLTVGPTERPDVSRMTVVVDTDEATARRAVEHLRKLVNVLEVQQLGSGGVNVVRDLALIRVNAGLSKRSEVLQLVEVFRANVVDIAEDTLVIECTGSLAKIEALVDTLRPFGIIELGRTGAVAMARGTPVTPKAAIAPLRTGTSSGSMSV